MNSSQTLAFVTEPESLHLLLVQEKSVEPLAGPAMSLDRDGRQEVLMAVLGSREILCRQGKGDIKTHRVKKQQRQEIRMYCKVIQFGRSSSYRV